LIGFLAVLFAGCQQQINYPAPNATGISPASAQAGQPAFTLMVTGSNFTPSSSVLWNGGARSTTFSSTSELTAQILATDIQNAGTASVQVFTPSPGGGTSPQPPKVLLFTINGAPSPVPQINSLSPSGAFTGSGGFTLTITGSNFVSLSIATVNGNNRSTGFVNSTSLQTTIFASDVANSGTLQIGVVNPQPNGGASNIVSFNVKNPAPSTASLTPVAFTAGGSTATLTVSGAGFVPDSVVDVNGAPRPTTVVSSAQALVSLTSGDLAAAGINQVLVVNPVPGGGTSNIQTFAVNPTDVAGLPMLVDVAFDGTQANNGICGASCSGVPTLVTAGPSADEDGAVVAFASTSTNFLADATSGLSDIFVRETCLSTASTTSSASCTPKTLMVNTGPDGVAADGSSAEPSLDSAGTHVAYTSTASNLENYTAQTVPTGVREVYWQPTCASTTAIGGCTASSTSGALVSVSPDGTTPGNADSYNPAISPDGQYVAFVSLATNLVQNVFVDGITPQVYIRDTCDAVPPATGACVPTTYLVSTSDGTTPGNAPSSHPAISNTGLFVAFVSTATNLGAPNQNGLTEIFDRSTCVTSFVLVDSTCVPETTLSSTHDGTTPADGASIDPAISSDGRFVAFASTATTLIVGVGPTQQIYVRDTCTGATTTLACAALTYLVSTLDGETPANALSENPSINGCGTTTIITTNGCATGQYITFASQASNLGANVENGVENVFVRDTCVVFPTPVTTTTTTPCLAYTLLASQPGGTTPPPANGSSLVPSISGDGHTVSFISSASNLVAQDTNALADIFLAGANLTFNLTVTLQGTGSGTVTDNTSQISCTQTAATSTTPLTDSGTCTAAYISGTSVTLTATASSGFSFTAWGGTAPSVNGATCTVTTGTTTSGTCEFVELQNNTATATFQ